jgi:hypothetical protein
MRKFDMADNKDASQQEENVNRWVAKYKAQGAALEGVIIDPTTGARTMPAYYMCDDDFVNEGEQEFLTQYKKDHPEIAHLF